MQLFVSIVYAPLNLLFMWAKQDFMNGSDQLSLILVLQVGLKFLK